MGTKSVPPPMPAGTATMPIRKQVANNASGQNHQGMVLAGTTLSAANAGSAKIRSSNNPRRRQAQSGTWTSKGGRGGANIVRGDRAVAGLHRLADCHGATDLTDVVADTFVFRVQGTKLRRDLGCEPVSYTHLTLPTSDLV